MSIARYYAYTDSGAPQITGEQGTLKEALKKILVGTGGVAYGAGADEKPSLGWSLEFESTAKAIFKGAIGSSGMLLRVDDDGPGAGSYREAFVYGGESASDVDTMTDRFPTSAQISGGLVFRKAQNLGSTPTPWWLWGDDRTFYLSIHWYGAVFCGLVWAGDFRSLKSGDLYNFGVGGGTTVNSSSSIPDLFFNVLLSSVATGNANLTVAARSHDQSTKSPAMGAFSGYSANGSRQGGAGPSYPAAITSGLICTPIAVHELNMPRGVLRGAYAPVHASGLTDLLTIAGVDGFPGATFHAVPSFGNNQGRIVIPTGVEWG